MRKVIIAGNWKMNKTLEETIVFVNKLKQNLQNRDFQKATPIIFPPYVFLDRCLQLLSGSNIHTGAQDVSLHESGAYTGEVSAPMLDSLGVRFCLAGHSERRQYHNETNHQVNQKAKILIKQDIVPVICIGEQEQEREKGITEKVILKQLEESLAGIESGTKFIIAYEPVWAIGTGKTATPEIAQEVHHLIRTWLSSNYSSEKAESISILYGGSIKVNNFASLLREKDIDGGLIGGASLSIDSYLQLIEIGEE